MKLCLLSLCCALFFSYVAQAQTSTESLSDTTGVRPFQGVFYAAADGITLHLDLYADTLLVPGFEFLGTTHGYMQGDTNEQLYGTWFLLSHTLEGNKALLRFSNDIGSDAQRIEFTRHADGSYTYKAVGGNEVKKAVHRKLYKVASEMRFMRKPSPPHEGNR